MVNRALAAIGAAVPCLTAPALLAGGVASVTINASHVSEPTWHNYGSTYTDAQGRTTRLNMAVPFFRTVSINTTVLVDLSNGEEVLRSMRARRVNGNTDLMVAAAAGNAVAVRDLLAKRAMVNPRNLSGATALMAASAGGFEDVARALIEKGARVDEKSAKGCTALMLAAKSGQEAIVDLLLASGADVNLTDSGKHTAIMYAIEGGQTRIAKRLLESGARTDYHAKSGVSPLALAAAREHPELVALLSQARPLSAPPRY
jgi:hypothetical protein